MSSPAPSDISQDDAEMLEEQRHEMQRRHEEEQQSLLRLQKAAEAHHAECAAQKARRKAEAKAKEETERQRIAEKKKKKKRTVEYLQQLRNEVLKEEATLLEGAKGSQVAGSKCKEVATGDEEGQRPSKKTRGKQPGKYHGGATVKMGVLTPARGVCAPGRIAWCTPQGEYSILILIIIFNNNFFFFIAAPLLVPGISHSSSSVYPTPTPIPQP